MSSPSPDDARSLPAVPEFCNSRRDPIARALWLGVVLTVLGLAFWWQYGQSAPHLDPGLQDPHALLTPRERADLTAARSRFSEEVGLPVLLRIEPTSLVLPPPFAAHNRSTPAEPRGDKAGTHAAGIVTGAVTGAVDAPPDPPRPAPVAHQPVFLGVGIGEQQAVLLLPPLLERVISEEQRARVENDLLQCLVRGDTAALCLWQGLADVRRLLRTTTP